MMPIRQGHVIHQITRYNNSFLSGRNTENKTQVSVNNQANFAEICANFYAKSIEIKYLFSFGKIQFRVYSKLFVKGTKTF